MSKPKFPTKNRFPVPSVLPAVILPALVSLPGAAYQAPNRVETLAEADGGEDEEIVLDALEIAGLPGLDLRETLQRLNGNRPLYGQIARMACAKYADIGRQVEQLLSGGELAAARQLLHAFKGVILNMGAASLGEFLVQMEKELTPGSDPDQQRLLLARLESLSAEAIGSLRTVVARYCEPAAQSVAIDGAAPPPSPLEQLRQLMEFLKESDPAAAACFASFRDRFGAGLPAERLLWIGEAIEQPDFPAALEYCSVLDAMLEEGSPQNR